VRKPKATLYLIHFDRKLAHAQHYVGSTSRRLADRIAEHQAGTGARLLAALQRVGIDFRVVYTERFDTPGLARIRERQLKRAKNLPKLCPICQ